MAPDLIRAALARSATLRPGDPLPGTVINPDVSVAHAREDDAAFRAWRAGQGIVRQRGHAEIARDMGVPAEIGRTLSADELAEARALLSAALAGESYSDIRTSYGSSGKPVNDRTVGAAVALIGSAVAMQARREAA